MKSMEHIRTRRNEKPAIEIVRAQPFPGYLPGFSQPVLLAEILIHRSRVTRESLIAIDRSFKGALSGYELPKPSDPASVHPLLLRLLSGTAHVLRSTGMPVFSEGKVMGNAAGHAGCVQLAFPALGQAHGTTSLALKWVVSVMNQCLSDESPKVLLSDLPAVLSEIRRSAPQGMNSLHFLQAAHDTGIPWCRTTHNVYQFGWGARGRLMDSSFTDVTPNIAVKLARDKRATAAVLRTAGIPVPVHALVADDEQAVKIAEQLGYPVVVKPADKDGGRGVSPDLRHAEAVRKAFAKAREFSAQVLVEKHFEGNDYRLQVFQGEVFWATHRVPGSVTGDGVRAITDLLAVTNAHPLRGAPRSNALLKRIDLDEEALELLQEQGLNPDSIPEVDRFVRLRRAANVASGGIPVPVLDQAHADNLALAVRAARVLRLDLAGVDLLIPDIRRSWLETGAAICEVNAQPQLSPSLPAYLLKRLVKGQGRIPVVMVLGNENDASWLEPLADMLSSSGRCAGVATPAGVRIGSQTVVKEPCNAYQGGMVLLSDPQVEVAFIHVADMHMLKTGLPVDRLNALILAGLPAADGDDNALPAWYGFARMLAETCIGPVIINKECVQWQAFAGPLKEKKVLMLPSHALADAVHQELSQEEP